MVEVLGEGSGEAWDARDFEAAAHEVGAAAGLFGHVLDAAAQVEQSLVGVGFLDGCQVVALRVLDDHELAFVLGREFHDPAWYLCESGLLGGGEPPVADDHPVIG